MAPPSPLQIDVQLRRICQIVAGEQILLNQTQFNLSTTIVIKTEGWRHYINATFHAVNTLLEYHIIWSILQFINKTLPVVYGSIRSIVADCKRVAEHPADEVFATFIGFSKAGSIYSRIFSKPRSIYQRVNIHKHNRYN